MIFQGTMPDKHSGYDLCKTGPQLISGGLGQFQMVR